MSQVGGASLTTLERYRGSQRAACSASRFANEVGTEFGVQSTAVDGYRLVDRVSEVSTISELRMNDVVKDANPESNSVAQGLVLLADWLMAVVKRKNAHRRTLLEDSQEHVSGMLEVMHRGSDGVAAMLLRWRETWPAGEMLTELEILIKANQPWPAVVQEGSQQQVRDEKASKDEEIPQH